MATTTLNGHSSSNDHGGARPGAGRKPKALKYASELAAAENKIMSALPSAVAVLVAAAESGDVSAAKYLLDRAFGRVTAQAAAIADDTAIPFDESDFERAESKKAFFDRMDTW
jgi:ribosomal protein S11